MSKLGTSTLYTISTIQSKPPQLSNIIIHKKKNMNDRDMHFGKESQLLAGKRLKQLSQVELYIPK